MKKHPIDDVIRACEKGLFAVLMICLALGAVGVVVQLLRWGSIAATGE